VKQPGLPAGLALAGVMVAAPALAGGVLWVGAHPDDEMLISPVLAAACRTDGVRCAFLVLTRGESGCDAQPCDPALAPTRAAEMQATAGYFGAQLTMLDLGDGRGATPDEVLLNWGARAGSSDALIGNVARIIENTGCDTIITFDPRHGTTWHPDHRAAGYVAIVAAQRAGYVGAFHLVESCITAGQTSTGQLWYGFSPAVATDTKLLRLDASANWPSLLDALRIDKSQFSDATVAAFGRAPAAAKSVFLLSLPDASDDLSGSSAGYNAACRGMP
jgi:LmbE family N-acetylglucosaminyl deacetylase